MSAQVMRQLSRFSEAVFESMKMGVFCCLDAQNGLTFTGQSASVFRRSKGEEPADSTAATR
jgi:hypothetical protein